MNTKTRWLSVAFLFGWLGLAHPAAATPGVRDEAKFFSSDTVAKADKVIGEMHRQYRTELVVDTVPKIPDDLQAKFKEQDKSKFFRDWAAQRAKDKGDKGIYVLVCKEPGRIEAIVD